MHLPLREQTFLLGLSNLSSLSFIDVELEAGNLLVHPFNLSQLAVDRTPVPVHFIAKISASLTSLKVTGFPQERLPHFPSILSHHFPRLSSFALYAYYEPLFSQFVTTNHTITHLDISKAPNYELTPDQLPNLSHLTIMSHQLRSLDNNRIRPITHLYLPIPFRNSSDIDFLGPSAAHRTTPITHINITLSCCLYKFSVVMWRSLQNLHTLNISFRAWRPWYHLQHCRDCWTLPVDEVPRLQVLTMSFEICSAAEIEKAVVIVPGVLLTSVIPKCPRLEELTTSVFALGESNDEVFWRWHQVYYGPSDPLPFDIPENQLPPKGLSTLP